jgi:hypothetical protein
MIIANTFLYAGFYIVKFKGNLAVSPASSEPTASVKILALVVVSMVFIYSGSDSVGKGIIGRLQSILGLFLNPGLIMLMALSYYWLFRKSLSPWFSIIFLTTILIDLAAHTLLSSRGAIISFIQDCILIILAVSGSIKLKRSYFILSVAMLPIILALLIGTYIIATSSRVNRILNVGSLSLMQSVEGLGNMGLSFSDVLGLNAVLPHIFARMGFFDFSAELIAHDQQYGAVINVPAYAKSVVDNILTPGFDVFDQPKISNALQFVYGKLGRPSRQLVSGNYQSDQFGLYGEWYVLFNYAAVPMLFFIAFGMKRIYVGLRSKNPFHLALQRVFVLVFFWKLVNSYGLDWAIMESVPMAVSGFIYVLFVQSKLTFSSSNSSVCQYKSLRNL